VPVFKGLASEVITALCRLTEPLVVVKGQASPTDRRRVSLSAQVEFDVTSLTRNLS
jgi:hypothetical protein